MLTVAAIPVAMPTVLSVTMAVGARLLAKKEAIVTRLAAIEELAGVDVLCSDKTGTLTQNKLTLGDPFSFNGIPADQVILCAALASRAEDKDTIDLAVIGGVKDDQACMIPAFRSPSASRASSGSRLKRSLNPAPMRATDDRWRGANAIDHGTTMSLLSLRPVQSRRRWLPWPACRRLAAGSGCRPRPR